MATRLGLMAVPTTGGGVMDPKEPASPEGSHHSRTNEFNRRRFGGLWGYAIAFLMLLLRG